MGVGGGEVAAKMRADIAVVDPASVVVNWECCGGCSDDRFHGNDAHGSTNDAPTMLMATLLARGFMVMVSDFSLGALIHNWDSAALGANPFKISCSRRRRRVTRRSRNEAGRKGEEQASST